MRHALLLASILLAGCQSGSMDKQHHEHIAIAPDQIKWQPAPDSLPPGAKVMVLEGDPSKPEFFTMRAWMPAGYRVPPHTHPAVERVTVISGTLYIGMGDTIDEAAAKPLPAGSYTSMPAGMHHFAFSKSETVIQISTIGPWGINYLNPADDPRNKPK